MLLSRREDCKTTFFLIKLGVEMGMAKGGALKWIVICVTMFWHTILSHNQAIFPYIFFKSLLLLLLLSPSMESHKTWHIWATIKEELACLNSYHHEKKKLDIIITVEADFSLGDPLPDRSVRRIAATWIPYWPKHEVITSFFRPKLVLSAPNWPQLAPTGPNWPQLAQTMLVSTAVNWEPGY